MTNRNFVSVQVSGTKKVNVNPGTNQNYISATPDTGLYYSQLAKNWAISDEMVQNEDYSSKHYAELAKENSLKAEENYEAVLNLSNSVIDNIITTSEEIKINVNNSITEHADAETEQFQTEIKDLVDENLEIIADYETASKGYAEDAKESAQLALSAAGIHYDVLAQEDVNVSVLGKDYVSYTEFTDTVEQLQPKGDYPTQEDVMSLIANIPQFQIHVSQTLPPTGNSMTLYLTPKDGTDGDVYNEYVWIEHRQTFEFLGTTAVDLTDYAKKTELSSYATKTELSSYATKTELNTKQNKLSATGTNKIPVYCDGYILKPVVALSAELVSGGFNKEIYYAHHPEMSDMHILPFIYNDFAFIDKKGGSYTIARNDNGEIGNPHNVFDAAPSFMHSRGFTEDTVWTIDIVSPKTFTYGTLLYVDFGASGFGCSYAKIEAQHSVTGEWKTVLEKSDISLSYVYCRCNSDDLGVNKFKFTFKNPFSAQQFRISAIGAISYKSAGVEETMLTLKGGTVYGDVIAPNITKLQNEVNTLKATIATLQTALSELK